MNSTAGILVGSYDYRLVVLSVLISILASYTALDIAGRITATRGRMRFAWLACGAGAMGTGIWSMHYVGMLAFSLPILIHYDWPTVAVSWLSAVFASGVALFVVSRRQMGWRQAVMASLVMGAGIAGMHYIGMAAMRLRAQCSYSSGLVALSIMLAIVISLVALWLTFRLREETHGQRLQKIASAVVMGTAIPVMHYTGMAAASFTASSTQPDMAHTIDISFFGTVAIVIATVMVLGSAVLTSMVERRFEAQAAALALERRYRHLVEAVQVILWRRNLSSSAFGFVSREAESLLGYPVEQWLASADFWIEHTHPDDRALVESCCKSPEGNKPLEFEHRMITAGGEICWLRCSIRLVDDPVQGRELLGVMVNISERKRLQEAAQAASRAKSEFLDNMSHELRTPMNGILGMAQLVLETNPTAEQREYIELLTVSAGSLLAIIDDVLDFSKIEAHALSMNRIDFKLRDVLHATIQTFAAAARQKDLKLEDEIAPEVPDDLIGDPLRVRQVLVNLVGNAVKFTARGEVAVKVALEAAGEQNVKLRFTVRDSGIGIPPEKQKLIFEAFSQADGSTARQFGGTGLGLTICSRLVELLGGELWVDSNPGAGSQFHFTAQFACNQSAHSQANSTREFGAAASR